MKGRESARLRLQISVFVCALKVRKIERAALTKKGHKGAWRSIFKRSMSLVEDRRRTSGTV
jgi:hypothetical protein